MFFHLVGGPVLMHLSGASPVLPVFSLTTLPQGRSGTCNTHVYLVISQSWLVQWFLQRTRRKMNV